MKTNVGTVGGFMHRPHSTARVYVYDVTHIVTVLENQPALPEVMHGYLPQDVLIDQFFQWALYTFQFLGIKDFRVQDLTRNAHAWFNQQQHASDLLWSMFNVEPQYAGRDTIVVRRRNTLWLFVIV